MIKQEGLVVQWFSNHQKPLAILRDKARAAFGGKSKELKKAGATRMGTNTFVGERLLELKSCLRQTVVDPVYEAENFKDLPDSVETSNCQTVSRENKAGTAKKHVLDDSAGGFWAKVSRHVKITMPICKFLRRHDTSAPACGKVYHGWFELGDHLAAADGPYASKAVEKHAERWAYSHSPFFAAAYVVDPEFIDHDTTSNNEVMDGFNDTIEKIGILLKARQLHASDGRYNDSWQKRKAGIANDPLFQKKWTDFPKYPDAKDPDVQEFLAAVSSQLVQYKAKKGTFGRDWIMKSAKDQPAYQWWDANGASVPELQSVARIILAQPASASICERINSEFEFVKDRRRNRLSHVKANKLVGLFHNLRMLKKMKRSNYSEPAVAWTEDLETSGVSKYMAGGSGHAASSLLASLSASPGCVP